MDITNALNNLMTEVGHLVHTAYGILFLLATGRQPEPIDPGQLSFTHIMNRLREITHLGDNLFEGIEGEILEDEASSAIESIQQGKTAADAAPSIVTTDPERVRVQKIYPDL